MTFNDCFYSYFYDINSSNGNIEGAVESLRQLGHIQLIRLSSGSINYNYGTNRRTSSSAVVTYDTPTASFVSSLWLAIAILLDIRRCVCIMI